jgi:hypothetical protein
MRWLELLFRRGMVTRVRILRMRGGFVMGRGVGIGDVWRFVSWVWKLMGGTNCGGGEIGEGVGESYEVVAY